MSTSTTTQPFTITRALKPIINNTVRPIYLYENRNDSFIEISKDNNKRDIPRGFRSLLSEFTKEILRNLPKDIVDFAIEYFKCLQQGLILDYPHRGQNIPCIFKPAIPKIPKLLKNQSPKKEIKQEKKEEKKYLIKI